MRRSTSTFAFVVATTLLVPPPWGWPSTVPSVLALLAGPAMAADPQAVGREAEAITVRLEGATSGSGVLVKRVSERYTVLTAWHVVEGQRPGEELSIFTADGQSHQIEQGGIQHLGVVDLAVLTFSSPKNYQLARIGDVKSVSSGSTVYVSGFPLPTSAVPSRIWRFIKGDVVANASVVIPNGYQLLYSNQTLPGMSGGAVLNTQGQVVGIHASAERADQISESSGKAVATGSNQAVPIGFYTDWASGSHVISSPSQTASADDYLAQAKQLLRKKGSEHVVMSLANQALAIKKSAEAYRYRADARYDLGDMKGAIADYTQAVAINPQYANVFNNRGNAKYGLGDKQGAISDYSQALSINPQAYKAYYNRGTAKDDLGDKRGAISDYSQALKINPRYAEAYYNRGIAKYDLGDKQGAIADYTQAIAINPHDVDAYTGRGNAKDDLNDKQGAILDYNQALSLNPQDANTYFNRGVVKNGLGDTQGACSDYKHSAALGSGDTNKYLHSEDGAWCRNMP